MVASNPNREVPRPKRNPSLMRALSYSAMIRDHSYYEVEYIGENEDGTTVVQHVAADERWYLPQQEMEAHPTLPGLWGVKTADDRLIWLRFFRYELMTGADFD